MGRKSVKENKSIYQQTGEELGLTREKAAELIPGFSPERLEKMGRLITILGNAGLEEKGEKPDLTEKWVLRNMKPALIIGYAIATMAEITAGNMMEAKHEEKGPVDEGLEEEQEKK